MTNMATSSKAHSMAATSSWGSYVLEALLTCPHSEKPQLISCRQPALHIPSPPGHPILSTGPNHSSFGFLLPHMVA